MKWRLRILPNKENEQATQELKILEEDVAAARNFLRKNYKTYFQGKKKVPIYLILGPSRFGKTTILSQAGLELIDINKQPFGSINPTKYCSFWFTKDAIYIDTAGNYTKPDITKPRNDMIWQGFIKLLQKYFGKNSIASILIILDLPAISQDKNLLNKTLFCIQERVYELAALIKHLNTHIIFTKCDRILGFTEFFSLLDPKERQEPFGISFPTDKKRDLITVFEDKFNSLLKNLNNRVVENLQSSIQPKDRSLIKIFPSQIDHLRQTFIDVISKIPNSNQILLSGIYFTSSIQDGAPINPIKNTLLHVLNLKEKNTYNLEANDNRSYFIEEIFKNTINLPTKHKKNRFNLHFHIEYAYALIITAIVIIASSFIGYKSYQKNITAIDQTNLALQTQNIHDHNNLYKIMTQIKQNSQSWWLTFGVNKIKTLYNSLTKTHQILFIQNLASQLENYLDITIDSQDSNKAQNLYQGLQVYLMFGNYKKLDPSYVKTWFNNHWSRTYNDKERQYLQQQLNTVLQHKFKIELNQQVIDTIRDDLNNLPPIQLTYLLLENRYTDQILNINDQITISKMYTKENFHKLHKESIPLLINNLPKHDWVLGDLELQLETDAKNSIKNLQKLYIKKYVATWYNMIKLETKKELENFNGATEYLNKISSAKSPLFSLLKKIKQNTNIKNPPKRLIKELNTKLKGINNLNLARLRKNLERSTRYITDIAKTPNSNQAAFTAITKYLKSKSTNNPIATLQTFANNQPPWLQTYLQAITSNIWQILLDATYVHITKAWDREIIPIYKKTLVNKYPIFKNSKSDIKLNDFNKFFGTHGIIDNFYKKYIKPFANTKKTKWEWKSINGQKINFSSDFLEVFLRGAMIQKMFFTNKTSKPKLRFNLTPIAMTPNTQSFSLDLDGQKISFANKSQNKKTKRLAWPGPKPGLVTISFVNAQGKYFTTSKLGTWAWFRILDKINVTSHKNTKRFGLTFDLNGNAAKYILSTTNSVNPFIPEVINNFRCPEKTGD